MITRKNDAIKRGIYIIPSIITAANLAAGFISIIWSIEHKYTPAAWAIIFAIAMDMMDGRIARWTRTSSVFGIEFDSLSDLISFGVAPSILIYQMILRTMNKPGIAIALFFVIAGALRLARFNSKAKEGDTSSHFIGLPIPAAAGILASFVLSYELFELGDEITVKTIPLLMKRMPIFFKSIPPVMVLISLLMISNVPYANFKIVNLDKPKSLQLLILIIIGLLLIITYPQNTIFIIFGVYLISGLMNYIILYWRMRRALKPDIRLQDELNN